MDMDMVRRNWAKELDGVSREGVMYAMANLPERYPPNVLEFRKLCQARRTEAARLALPAPKPAGMSEATRERMAQALAPLRRMSGDPREWARRLRMRELACETLSRHQREMWRDALRIEAPKPVAAEAPPFEMTTTEEMRVACDPFAVLDVSVAMGLPDEHGNRLPREGVARVKTMTDEWIVKGSPLEVQRFVVEARRAMRAKQEAAQEKQTRLVKADPQRKENP
jgi:hypothetical protein